MWTCFTLFLFVKYLNEKTPKNWKWKNVKKNKRKNISHLLVNYLPSFLIIISLLSSFKKKTFLFFFFLSSRVRSCLTQSQPSTAQPRWTVWEQPPPTWCRSELAPWPDTDATATPWTSAPPAWTVRPPTHTHTGARLTGDAWRFPVTLPTNEGSGLTVVTANANWRLSQMKRPSFSLSSADVCCVCVCVWRWPSEVGAGPAASHRGLGLRWSGGDCCHGGYRCCLP